MDEYEAAASEIMKGVVTKNVAYIFDVFSFNGEQDIFGVVLEHLSPVDGKVKTEVDRIGDWWSDWGGWNEKSIGDAKKGYLEYLRSEHCQCKVKQILEPVFNGLFELRKQGIEYDDLHCGNIGKKGRVLKIFDLRSLGEITGISDGLVVSKSASSFKTSVLSSRVHCRSKALVI